MPFETLFGKIVERHHQALRQRASAHFETHVRPRFTHRKLDGLTHQEVMLLIEAAYHEGVLAAREGAV